MRIQKVNESTIRIFISFNELAERDVTMADLFQRSAKSEQLFWELIAQAREEVEFNLDQPFWIQATAASNDEFVITVMKQEDTLDTVVVEKEKSKKTTTRSKAMEWVYAFNDFEDLLAAIKRIPEFARVRSSLFEFEGVYYLAVSHLGSGKKKHYAQALFNEYGDFVDVAKVFLAEHGRVIINTRAIQILKEKFAL